MTALSNLNLVGSKSSSKNSGKKTDSDYKYLGFGIVDDSGPIVDAYAIKQAAWILYKLEEKENLLIAAFIQLGANSVANGYIPTITFEIGDGNGSEPTKKALRTMASKQDDKKVTLVHGTEILAIIQGAIKSNALDLPKANTGVTQSAKYALYMQQASVALAE